MIISVTTLYTGYSICRSTHRITMLLRWDRHLAKDICRVIPTILTMLHCRYSDRHRIRTASCLIITDYHSSIHQSWTLLHCLRYVHPHCLSHNKTKPASYHQPQHQPQPWSCSFTEYSTNIAWYAVLWHVGMPCFYCYQNISSPGINHHSYCGKPLHHRYCP